MFFISLRNWLLWTCGCEGVFNSSNMLFFATEMDVEFVQVLKQGTKRRSFGHLGEGVHILGEAFAAIAELAVGARHIGVRVVDIA